MDRPRNATAMIAEMAQTIPSRLQFRAEAMKLLGQLIGYDDCMFHLLDPNEPFARGFFITEVPKDIIVEAQGKWNECYGPELKPLWDVADKQGGVVVDTLAVGPDTRNRLNFYREIVPFTGIRHFMWCHLYVRGQLVAQVSLARRGQGFKDNELRPLQELRPVLAIAEASYRAAPSLVDNELQSRLTQRELEIVDLVIRGLTNPEIATALNLSLHTVRNHLNHVFNKLSVTTRAELAGLGVVRPDAA
jgi:DNA-binding CsgD family transcriptional regulator